MIGNEAELRTWAAVIHTPLERLAAYHGSGASKEQIAAFIDELLKLGILGGTMVETD